MGEAWRGDNPSKPPFVPVINGIRQKAGDWGARPERCSVYRGSRALLLPKTGLGPLVGAAQTTALAITRRTSGLK